MTIELATISRTPLSGLLKAVRATMSARMTKVSTNAHRAAMIIIALAALSLIAVIDVSGPALLDHVAHRPLVAALLRRIERGVEHLDHRQVLLLQGLGVLLRPVLQRLGPFLAHLRRELLHLGEAVAQLGYVLAVALLVVGAGPELEIVRHLAQDRLHVLGQPVPGVLVDRQAVPG